MKIQVLAKTKSRKVGVRRLGYNKFEVAVTEPPVDGKANRAIIKALAAYLDIPSMDVVLISGHSSKQKRFEIPDDCMPPWQAQQQLDV